MDILHTIFPFYYKPTVDKVMFHMEKQLEKSAKVIFKQYAKLTRLARFKARVESLNDYLKNNKKVLAMLIDLKNNTDWTNVDSAKNKIDHITAQLCFGVDELKKMEKIENPFVKEN